MISKSATIFLKKDEVAAYNRRTIQHVALPDQRAMFGCCDNRLLWPDTCNYCKEESGTVLKFYQELASWWPLISPPEEYEEEVAFFLPLFAPITTHQPASLLELGSGGGHNALYMKHAFASVTLTDLSEPMLEVSRHLNPDCEHLQADMRTLRLGRTFDAVFVHDAVTYMTTLDDLKQALVTAFVHCSSGGMALFIPDEVSESFEPSTDHGGSDGDGRSARYLEWTYDPDETDTTITTDYVFLLREGDQPVRVEHDQHINGLFSREQWLELLHDVGFQASFVIDPFDRHVFIARKERVSSSSSEHR